MLYRTLTYLSGLEILIRPPSSHSTACDRSTLIKSCSSAAATHHNTTSFTSRTMSYNQRRYETLRRLGIEQIPALQVTSYADQVDNPFLGDLPVRTMPVFCVPLSHSQDRVLTPDAGPRPSMSLLCSQRTDCLGNPRQALPSVWDSGELSRPGYSRSVRRIRYRDPTHRPT